MAIDQKTWDGMLDDITKDAQEAEASGHQDYADQARAAVDELRKVDPATVQEPTPIEKGKRLDEVMDFGKPLLLECGSSNGALSLAKEAATMKGHDNPSVIDCDQLLVPDANSFQNEFDASGQFVIITEPNRAAQDVRDRVAQVMADPSKIVVVVTQPFDKKKPIVGLEPAIFSGAGGHYVSMK